jgi:hypothetical protein
VAQGASHDFIKRLDGGAVAVSALGPFGLSGSLFGRAPLRGDMRMLRRVIALSALALLAVLPSTAQSYVHTWTCTAYAGVACYDHSGQQYNPWISVEGHVTDAPTVPTFCSKGVTAAGNIRSASGCFNNVYGVVACFGTTTPESWGYVYWDNGGGIHSLAARASTDAC